MALKIDVKSVSIQYQFGSDNAEVSLNYDIYDESIPEYKKNDTAFFGTDASSIKQAIQGEIDKITNVQTTYINEKKVIIK